MTTPDEPRPLLTITVLNTKEHRHLFERAIAGDEQALEAIRAVIVTTMLTPESLKTACRHILGE